MTQTQDQLASRRDRFMAAMVDTLVYLIPYAGVKLGDTLIQIVSVLACLGYVVVQAYLLTTRGQSVGKIAYGLRIVKTETGENGGFVTNVALRMWLNGLIAFVPLYALVDALFIFRQDRRCVHDFIAGTKVVMTRAYVGAEEEEEAEDDTVVVEKPEAVE